MTRPIRSNLLATRRALQKLEHHPYFLEQDRENSQSQLPYIYWIIRVEVLGDDGSWLYHSGPKYLHGHIPLQEVGRSSKAELFEISGKLVAIFLETAYSSEAEYELDFDGREFRIRDLRTR